MAMHLMSKQIREAFKTSGLHSPNVKIQGIDTCSMDGPYNRPEKTLFIIFAILALILLVTPFLNESGTLVGLDGSTSTIDNADKWEGMDPLSYIVYYAGDMMCHQKEDRSILLNDNQIAVCARDLGLFLGVPLGFLFLWMSPRQVPWIIIIAVMVPMVLDGGIQLITDYESNNIMRVATGLFAGGGISFAMMRIYDNMTGE